MVATSKLAGGFQYVPSASRISRQWSHSALIGSRPKLSSPSGFITKALRLCNCPRRSVTLTVVVAVGVGVGLVVRRSKWTWAMTVLRRCASTNAGWSTMSPMSSSIDKVFPALEKVKMNQLGTRCQMEAMETRLVMGQSQDPRGSPNRKQRPLISWHATLLGLFSPILFHILYAGD